MPGVVVVVKEEGSASPTAMSGDACCVCGGGGVCVWRRVGDGVKRQVYAKDAVKQMCYCFHTHT